VDWLFQEEHGAQQIGPSAIEKMKRNWLSLREKMMLHPNRRVLGFIALLGVCVVCPPALAQGLPTGEEILEKNLAANGGKEAFEKTKNRVAKGTMEVKGAGLKGTIAIYTAAPNKMYTEVELPGIGKIEDGVDGTVAWSVNPTTGPMIKDGEQKAVALRRADFYSDVNWRKHTKSAKCLGEETVEGKPCYKVEVTTTEGQTRTQCFDKANYLLIKSVSVEKTPNGDLPVEAVLSDYRKVDGLMFPFKTVQKILSNEIVLTMDKVEHNVKIPDSRFDLPEEIKKLAAQKDKK
jgi:hypothetical protein